MIAADACLRRLGDEGPAPMDTDAPIEINLASLSLWEYERAMMRRAGRSAKTHLRLEIAIVLGCAFGAACTEALVKGFVDLVTLAIGVGGGFGGALAIIAFFLAPAGKDNHNELVLAIAQHTQRIEFSAKIRERWNQIKQIAVPPAADKDAWEAAIRQLGTQEELIVKLLRSPESTWQFAPKGWDVVERPLPAWAGLGQVMAERYDTEHTPIGRLYDRGEDGVMRILPQRFEMQRNHSAMTAALIVREIEKPWEAKLKEKPGTFLATARVFLPLPPVDHNMSTTATVTLARLHS